jgi:hypothetical protein
MIEIEAVGYPWIAPSLLFGGNIDSDLSWKADGLLAAFLLNIFAGKAELVSGDFYRG